MADLFGTLGDFFSAGGSWWLGYGTADFAQGLGDALMRTVRACSEMASDAEQVSDVLKSAADIGAFFNGGRSPYIGGGGGFSASREVIERDSSAKSFFGGIGVGGGLAAVLQYTVALESARAAALGTLGTIGLLGASVNVFRENTAGAYDITLSFGGILGGTIAVALAALENNIILLRRLFGETMTQSVNSAAVLAAFFAGMWDDPVTRAVGRLTWFGSSALSVIGSVVTGIGAISAFTLPGLAGGTAGSSALGVLSGSLLRGAALFGGNIFNGVSNVGGSIFNSVSNSVSKIGGGLLSGGLIRYDNAFAAGYLIGDVLMRSAGIGDVYSKVSERAELDRITSEASKISVNTEKTASVSEISGEELKFLRDIAARDVINRFTTAQVSVSMGGVTNNLSGTADLDGIVDYLTNGVKTALENAAEGVHS